LAWIAFIACLLIILYAGIKLARYGDTIADKTGLGGIWVGMILLAGITSIPELATSISATAFVGSADLATGTLFGSNLFNLAILALLDMAHPAMPLLSVIKPRQALLAWGVVIVTIIGGIGVLFRDSFADISLGWVSIVSILLLVTYALIIWRISRLENKDNDDNVIKNECNQSLKSVWIRFSIAAIAVIVGGIGIAFAGDAIAEQTGLEASFVGSLLLAIGTSAPELVVAFAALKIGNTEMALADILGSNIFNIAIIFFADIFYTEGQIFADTSNVHLITAGAGISMALLVILGLRYKQKQKAFNLFGWYTPLLLVLYIGGFIFLYRAGIS